MSEVQTEAQAEDVLLAAILAPDEEAVDAPKLDTPEEVGDEEEEEGEVEAKTDPKAKTEEEAPEDDEIEIDGGEGKEPTRLKLKDVVADYQEFQAFKAQKDQIIDRVERETVERMSGGYRQIEQAGQQMGYMVQAALQLLQAPQAPNADAMLNPASPQYDPDGYHRAFANYQRMSQQYQQAQGLGKQLMEQAQAATQQATELRESRELERLNRAWPEFSQPETMNKFVSDMTKSYGFTPEELDAVLTDHRQALVARDALAFRAMKAQSGDVKAKVEAKAPKLVRSKQEAKGGAAAQRDDNGRFSDGALANLRKTNSDDAAVAYFAGLAKAGRI